MTDYNIACIIHYLLLNLYCQFISFVAVKFLIQLVNELVYFLIRVAAVVCAAVALECQVREIVGHRLDTWSC